MSNAVVLSVEDCDADFYVIEMALHSCLPDPKVRRASDGDEAIDLLEKGRRSVPESLPDLVLLDRNLPRKDGFAVLRYLHARKLTDRIPIVMFTSAATPFERRRALDLGARDVVTKPVDFDDLLARIRQVCAKELLHK